MHGDDQTSDGEIQEPDNSTVEHWTGQDIERDTEVAEKAARENDTVEEAEQQFAEEADGEQAHEQAYPSPGEGPARGPA